MCHILDIHLLDILCQKLNFTLLPPLFSSPRSLAGAAMFITSVILGTVIFVTKKGSNNVG